MQAMEIKAKRKEEARLDAACRKEEAIRKKTLLEVEKRQKEDEKSQKLSKALAKEAFRSRWTTDAIREAGECLQSLLQNPPPLPPPGSCIAPFCGYLPPICKENIQRRLTKRLCIKFGGNATDVLPLVPPP